jgi:membrane fusion protein
MRADPLYRAEVLQARQAKWLGEIVMLRPISFRLLTCLAVAFAGLLVIFLVWGTYTKRTSVQGQLVPDTGLIKLYPPQQGVVIEKHVVEGQPVNQGEVLYILSIERQSTQLGNVQALISTQVESKEISLKEELNKTRLVQSSERRAIANKVSALKAELAKIQDQIESQKKRVQMAGVTISRYQKFVTEGFISSAQLQQRQEELLDQLNRQQSLERDYITVSREFEAQQIDLLTLPLRHQNQLGQIERNITITVQELTESEAKRRLVIVATETGIATALSADVGQTVDGTKPVTSIVPKGASLQAHLYAPSKAIGFIKPGHPVLLRYQAYPYQKFGQAKGIVISVSKTAILPSELNGIGNLPLLGIGNTNEPLYRITVALEEQTINAYGTAQILQAGMLLDADVMQETRRLYEWVLEPLYSITGKL